MDVLWTGEDARWRGSNHGYGGWNIGDEVGKRGHERRKWIVLSVYNILLLGGLAASARWKV